MREENGVKIFTDMKAFYRYIQSWSMTFISTHIRTYGIKTK